MTKVLSFLAPKKGSPEAENLAQAFESAGKWADSKKLTDSTSTNVVSIFRKQWSQSHDKAEQYVAQKPRLAVPVGGNAVQFQYTSAEAAIKQLPTQFMTAASNEVDAGVLSVVKNIAYVDSAKVHEEMTHTQIEETRFSGAEELASAFFIELSPMRNHYNTYISQKIKEFQSRIPNSSEKTQAQINAFIQKAKLVNEAINKIHRKEFLSRVHAVVHAKTGWVAQYGDFATASKFRSVIWLSAAEFEVLPPDVKNLVDNFQKYMSVYFENFKVHSASDDKEAVPTPFVNLAS